jgi:hypothetical protein
MTNDKVSFYMTNRQLPAIFSRNFFFKALVLIYISVQSQFALCQKPDAETIHIASPTASSLGKFIDMPVSYHTGTPDVSIPIYVVSDGPLQVPITLSYHASGLKVMEQASWVGAGWALKAGGVVTRSTRGNPDEITAPNGGRYLNSGYYSYLFRNELGYNPPVLAYGDFASGQRDGEADLFFFNCGEYSGKFLFRADNSIAVMPEQDVRVKPLICDSDCATNEVLYGWIITTPDGIQYHYGKTEETTDVDPIEHSTPYSTATGIAYSKEISSWYLNKIVSSDGLHTINFRYAKENYGFYSISMFPRPSTGWGLYSGSGINLSKIIMNGVRLTAIEFNNGTVSFIPDTNFREDLSSDGGGLMDLGNETPNQGATNARALKQIRVQGTNFDKTFEFNYGYFFDNTNAIRGTFGRAPDLESQYNIHSDKKRLKLLSFQERSTDGGVVIPPYVFSYHDETSVPRTLLLAQDHWGYYNGANANTELIPSLSTNDGASLNEGLGANREASWPAMRAGAMYKIQYPTGGFTEFEFEPHDNGYTRTYYTHDKATQLFSRSAGFTGADYTSVTETISLSGGKYMVELDGSNLLTGSMGTLHVGNYSYSIAPGLTSSTLVDIPLGTYQIYVTVSSPISTGHGVMGKLFTTVPVQHVEHPLIGGLRLKSFRFNDGSEGSNDIVQQFDYKNSNGESQGVLYSRPVYIALARNDRFVKSGISNGVDVYETPAGCPPLPAEAYFISPSSLHAMRSSQGSHVGYNQVKVTQADGGYTIYKYRPSQNPSGDLFVNTINKSYCDPLAPNFPPAPESSDFSRGELRKVVVYNAAGIRLKETNSLTEYTEESVGINGLIVKPLSTLYLATEYEFKNVKKTKTASVEWLFNADDPAALPVGKMTETFFESTRHSFPVRTVVTEVTAPSISSTEIAQVIKGKVLSETRNTYVADILIPTYGCNSMYGDGGPEQALLLALSSALSTYNATISTAPCSTSPNCKWEAYLDYLKEVNDRRIDYTNSRAVYFSNYTTCMANSATYSQASTELKAMIDLKKRNEIIGVLESSRWRDGNFMGSSFTTFQMFDGNPLFIYPGKEEIISVASPLASGSFAPMTNNATSITKDANYSLESSYQYKNGNVVEVTTKNGVVTSYLWLNDLPIAKAIGIPFSTLQPAYAASGNSLTALRAHPWLAGALLSTYTYDPLVGMKTQTDPNNRTTYYLFDNLGRLKFIKDNEGNLVNKTEYGYKN